jgi:hypothetical protein
MAGFKDDFNATTLIMSRKSSSLTHQEVSILRGLEHSSDDDYAAFPEEKDMTSLSLKDSFKKLANPRSTVIRVDAVIPTGTSGQFILQLFLSKMSTDIRGENPILVLSIKFNQFDNAMKEMFIAWLDDNATLETLYVLGSGFDGAYLKKLHASWKKRLGNHRFENHGNSLHRCKDANLNEDSEGSEGK